MLRLAPLLIGESHSPVVHELWVLVVAGSNPASPTGPFGTVGDSESRWRLPSEDGNKSRLPDPNSFVTSLDSRFDSRRIAHLLPKIEKLDRFSELR